MFTIYKKMTFDSAHHLDLPYDSPCNRLHGHTYTVEVWISSEELNNVGMIFDFTEIRKIVMRLDHITLNEHPGFKTKRPTAENIAKFIHERINFKQTKVRVWETPNSYAEYSK